MKIKFWGVRGSIPAPLLAQDIKDKVLSALQEIVRQGIELKTDADLATLADSLQPEIVSTIGGNTTCISLETEDLFIIFDAGSGMRDLGQYLMSREFGAGKGHACIFFTHTHWDHIQGFPFFVPAFVPGNQFDIYHIHPYVPKVLAEQMQPEFFPAEFSRLDADIRFHQIEEGQEVVLGDLKINSLELYHPNKAYSYRVDNLNSSMVLATDGEYTRLDRAFMQRYYDFYRDADVLIFDAQYSVREAIIKEEWGHSSGMFGADIAKAANVKKLLLFHHDPTSTDAEIIHALAKTQEYLAKQTQPINQSVEVDVAVEGMEIDLDHVDAGRFSIEETQINQTLCLKLSGEFDGQASEIFARHLLDIMQAERSQRLVLDMAELDGLTMAGMSALLDARRQTYSMALVNVPKDVYDVLELAGTTDFFAIYDRIEDALGSYAG
ncbi:MAG TPA: STAS domain-containing protein [Chloroflexi bacterium]|nr:STAS domain-containing protein [Chloroflexota bacterium]